MKYVDFSEKIRKVENECLLEFINLMKTFDLNKVVFDNDSDNLELYPLILPLYNDYGGADNVTIKSVELNITEPLYMCNLTIKVENDNNEYDLGDFGDNAIIYIYDRAYSELNRTDI